MVESNKTLASSPLETDEDMEGQVKRQSLPVHFHVISREDAEKNLAFLRSQADSWFAVLFNVFGSFEKESRGMVGEVIAIWATITKDNVRVLYYRR